MNLCQTAIILRLVTDNDRGEDKITIHALYHAGLAIYNDIKDDNLPLPLAKLLGLVIHQDTAPGNVE